jgi:maltose alpha-D-glucosyltransferase/alpha-amylase
MPHGTFCNDDAFLAAPPGWRPGPGFAGHPAMLDLWYKNAVFYSLDVDTFADGNGDGIGDFRGLTGKLDYLASLNINCIWLLPFYPSPNRDNGYDVIDFYGVDHRLGTLGDFVTFTREARERGIRVIVDLVANHTSIDHPWFQQARRNKDSVYRGYYVWSDTRPEDADEGMVFPGEQESTWTYDEEADAYYFHRFYAHQPDLNVANPAVREEIAKVMSFWLQLGVSGFRVDAVPFLIELRGIDAPGLQPFDFLEEFRTYLSWRQGDAVMLAEANVIPDQVDDYFGSGDRLQMMFNFWANQHLFLALTTQDRRPLVRAFEALPELPRVCQWASFLRNHDELDLGRLTKDQRQQVFEALAPDPGMRLFGRGIRRRLAPMLDGDRRRLELAYSLMLTLPGSPVIWYGEEIGMGDLLSLEGRSSVRTPMQWNDERNAGFSTAPAAQLIRPVVEDGPFEYRRINVEQQRRDPESLLSWIERALRVRRECREFGWGECEFLSAGPIEVLVHRCRLGASSVLLAHNLSDREQRLRLPLRQDHVARDLLSMDEKTIAHDTIELSLDPYGYRWLREYPPRAAGPPEDR